MQNTVPMFRFLRHHPVQTVLCSAPYLPYVGRGPFLHGVSFLIFRSQESISFVRPTKWFPGSTSERNRFPRTYQHVHSNGPIYLLAVCHVICQPHSSSLGKCVAHFFIPLYYSSRLEQCTKHSTSLTESFIFFSFRRNVSTETKHASQHSVLWGLPLTESFINQWPFSIWISCDRHEDQENSIKIVLFHFVLCLRQVIIAYVVQEACF